MLRNTQLSEGSLHPHHRVKYGGYGTHRVGTLGGADLHMELKSTSIQIDSDD